MDRTVGLRWFSFSNSWMDCLVLVNGAHKETAAKVIIDAMDAWSDDPDWNDTCYGDCIDIFLNERGIPHVMDFCDADADVYPEREEQWERRLESYISVGIEITQIH